MLSIVIKTLNEEEKIARAIESAIAAAKECQIPYEIIVADSVSTDRTVEIASRYPVRVVQFESIADRGCGAGVQLGYQYSRGDFVYIFDGDMEFMPGFLLTAVSYLHEHPDVGGVGGLIEDEYVRNDIDRIRVNNKSTSTAGNMPSLGQGGLYRRSAIEAAGGYAADRNLLAWEEADLGMRLRAAGWRLVRLPVIGVRHTGHNVNTWDLLSRHWRSGRAKASGVLLRAALPKPWRMNALRLLIHPLLMLLWWLAMVLTIFLPSGMGVATALALVICLLSGFLMQLVRKRNLRHVLVSLYHWNYAAIAIMLGFFVKRISPLTIIPANVLFDHAES